MPIILTFKTRVYTTPAGYQRLDGVLTDNRRLYNALLQERQDAYCQRVPVMYTTRKGEERVGTQRRPHPHPVRIDKAMQSRSLTLVRQDDPSGLGSYSRRIQIGTLERLDRAFQAFQRRVKAGEKPGYPRFQGAHRFSTLEMTPDSVRRAGCDKPRPPRVGEGWFKLARRIQVPGLPLLRLRKDIPAGEILYLRLTRKSRAWHASLSVRLDDAAAAAYRLPDTGAVVGIDLGATDRAHTSDGVKFPRMEDDWAGRKRAQRKMARRRRPQGQKASRGYRAARAELGRVTRKDANRRLDTAHKISRQLVNGYDLIALEKLAVQRMMKSAAGTVDEPGRNVAAKRGLNRSIQQQGWAQLRTFLAYKAAWAGRQLVAVNPAHTSQTCAACGVIDPDARRGKRFACRNCGHSDDADHNAALNILRRALALLQAGEAKPPGADTAGAALPLPRKPHRMGATRRGRSPPAPTPGAIQGALPLTA